MRRVVLEDDEPSYSSETDPNVALDMGRDEGPVLDDLSYVLERCGPCDGTGVWQDGKPCWSCDGQGTKRVTVDEIRNHELMNRTDDFWESASETALVAEISGDDLGGDDGH